MKKKTETTKKSQPRSANMAFNSSRNEVIEGDDDIIDLILNDHVPLKTLIAELKEDDLDRRAKAPSFEEFAYLLMGHAKAEEQVLYVAMKNIEALKMPAYEGDTEHAIADQLVQEINATPDDNEWLAKVKVLAESVEHHIDEEEAELLKDVKEHMTESQRMILGTEYQYLLDRYLKLNQIKTPMMVKFRKVVIPPVAQLRS